MSEKYGMRGYRIAADNGNGDVRSISITMFLEGKEGSNAIISVEDYRYTDYPSADEKKLNGEESKALREFFQ